MKTAALWLLADQTLSDESVAPTPTTSRNRPGR